jgi:hypothetical protein
MDILTTPATNVFALIPRADGDNNENGNSNNNNTDYSDMECPVPLERLVGTGEPIFGDTSLHEFMVYFSAACLGLTALSCWYLSWRHLHRYTSPQEQRQILRVINLPFFYCLFNFLAVTFTMNYILIEPLSSVYEAFAVAALFFLLLEYVAPDGTDRETFFENTEMRNWKGQPVPGGSLKWYKVSIFQREQACDRLLT